MLLDGLAEEFLNICPVAALGACDQNRSQQYDMPCYFNLCSLEINSNGGLKQNHLEFSSSATKNIISPLPRCLWLTKLGRVVAYHEGLPPIKSHEALITWSSNISWQTKFIINSTTRVVMTTKLGKMVAHLNGLLPIKSYDPMIT